MTVAVAVDMVVLTVSRPDPTSRTPGGRTEPARLQLLAVRRSTQPFSGSWSLPGRIVRDDEDLDTAAAGALRDQTGVADVRHSEQLATFGAPDRDPRGRVVSIAYLGLLPAPVDVAQNAQWMSPTPIQEKLAFDHGRIVAAGVSRLRSKLGYSNVAYGLLPDEFTLGDLQAVYEAVLGTDLDKRNFRKKVLGLDLLVETGHVRRGAHRPAMLYRFADPALVTIATAAIA